MATSKPAITVAEASVFDLDFLEATGRYVIASVDEIYIYSDNFIDGIVECPELFVSNSMLAIREGNVTVDLDNLPDNLEFLFQDDNLLWFVIKGDCDIPLIKLPI